MSKLYNVPLEQATHEDFYEQEILLQPQTSLNASALSSASNNTAPLDFHIYRYEKKKCQCLIVEYDLQNTDTNNSITVTPSPFFQSYIEYRDSGNKLLQTLYSFNLFKNLSMLDADQARQILPEHGINYENWKPDQSCTLAPGQKQQFFLYILGDVFATNGNIFMEWKDYLLVRLYLQNSIESGTGTLQVNQIQLRIRTQEDHGHVHRANAKYADKYNFLDYLSVTSQPAQTISSALTQIRLQNFIGHNVVTDIVLRNGTNTANGQYRNYISLGRQAQLNYYNGQNKPLLGGSPLDANESRLLLAPRHVSAPFYKYNAVYPIYFGRLALAQKFGRMEGAIYENSYNQVGIQSSPDAFSAPVITITPSGTAASGYFNLEFTSPVTRRTCSTSMLAYNSTAAQIQSALYALPNWDDSNTNTITVSGPLTAAATFTFGGAQYANDFVYEISSQTLRVVLSTAETSGAVAVTFSSSLFTPGNDGFTSQSVRVDIYSSIFRALTIDKNENLGIEDITDTNNMMGR